MQNSRIEILVECVAKVQICIVFKSQTQIRVPNGGERVTCRGLKYTNSLGRIKLTNSLKKQQLKLWTRT